MNKEKAVSCLSEVKRVLLEKQVEATDKCQKLRGELDKIKASHGALWQLLHYFEIKSLKGRLEAAYYLQDYFGRWFIQADHILIVLEDEPALVLDKIRDFARNIRTGYLLAQGIISRMDPPNEVRWLEQAAASVSGKTEILWG